jgi:hypothetical protein
MMGTSLIPSIDFTFEHARGELYVITRNECGVAPKSDTFFFENPYIATIKI